MAGYTPLAIYSKPGCKRDGTLLEGDAHVDNQWCRYQLRKGLPRKMGGYRRLTNDLAGITRGMNVWNRNQFSYVHTGWSNGIEQFTLDPPGNASSIIDRTPVGFVADPNNLWQMDTLYDGSATTTALLAHAAPNLADISADTEQPVYFGDVTAGTPLAATASPDVSGGVFALGPYAVSYGNDGIVNWSPVNDVAGSWTGARPAASKFVAGLQIRAGAGNGPSGLIWGLDGLTRMTFIGSSAVFNFDTITPQYSILSSQSIIEYDGIYYWVGIDKFLSFNGVIQEVENGMNQNWFFDNLNYAAAQKVFATKIPRWGEIWFCYPRGSATECTHAVILNVRLSRIFGYNVWYDTQLPNSGRSCAQYARVFRSPLFTGVDADTASLGYKLWQHEAPMIVDEVDGTKILAIQSYYETNSIFPALPEGAVGNNQSISVEYIEPDFVQSGDMTVQVLGSRSNARAPDAASAPFPFPDTATSADDQVVYLREQRRQMRFRFESNTTGGDYQAGDIVGQFMPGDARITS